MSVPSTSAPRRRTSSSWSSTRSSADDAPAEYGNCASPTVYIVLEDLIARDAPRPGDYGVMLAFGPGLTMEGALLRF